MQKGTKNINIEVTTECWKKLKILSIGRDMTLQDVVKEILENSMKRRSSSGVEEEVK